MSNTNHPMDHAPGDEGIEEHERGDIEKNVKSKSTWLRLIFMILLGCAWSIAVLVTGAVVVLNFFYVLFTGETNSRLTEFGHQLATYLYGIAEYMTFNTETRPFPFDEEWPGSAS